MQQAFTRFTPFPKVDLIYKASVQQQTNTAACTEKPKALIDDDHAKLLICDCGFYYFSSFIDIKHFY